MHIIKYAKFIMKKLSFYLNRMKKDAIFAPAFRQIAWIDTLESWQSGRMRQS